MTPSARRFALAALALVAGTGCSSHSQLLTPTPPHAPEPLLVHGRLPTSARVVVGDSVFTTEAPIVVRGDSVVWYERELDRRFSYPFNAVNALSLRNDATGVPLALGAGAVIGGVLSLFVIRSTDANWLPGAVVGAATGLWLGRHDHHVSPPGQDDEQSGGP